MVPEKFLVALRTIHAALLPSNIDWAVTGSLGMALQGMQLPVNDIDLQTDVAGARALHRRLREFEVTPLRFKESESIRSHLGKLEIQGVPVEVIGAVQTRLPDGAWGAPVQIAPIRRWVKVEGMDIPVVSLAHEVQAYRQMGRPEKAELLRRWLNEHGAG